jgi:ankyrin repeat domain-containing protein 50
VVKQLLDLGQIDIESMDSFGQRPYSIATVRGHAAVVKLLLDTGEVEGQIP